METLEREGEERSMMMLFEKISCFVVWLCAHTHTHESYIYFIIVLQIIYKNVKCKEQQKYDDDSCGVCVCESGDIQQQQQQQ